MSDPQAHIVIVGAGHAGGTAAALLRQYGHAGPITMVGQEPVPPYQRPPLSKAWLKGEADADILALKPASFYAEQRIELRLETVVVELGRAAKAVRLASGETIAYDILILATGARARRLTLPGVELEGILELRTASDAERLKLALGPGRTLAIVGGGYVGLEAAASARALGADVALIEVLPRLLARVASEPLAKFFHDYHQARGVRIRLGASITGFTGDEGRITGISLADGGAVACDAALIGVGAIPNEELAREAGIACANGVVVDLEARTSDPAIFAIGDVTNRPMPLYDRTHRLESVPNALEQARQAACAITGRPAPSAETPWFWSDQYDLKLQIAGIPFEADDIVVRGDPTRKGFAVFHLKGDTLLAVESGGFAPEFMVGRQLIASRHPINRVRLADPGVSMKEVAA